MILESCPKKLELSFAPTDIASLQERFFLLQKESFEQKIGHIFLIEGWASSGKGKLLQVLTERLDPRKFKVHSPYVHLSEDRGYPFLWNFWKVLPRFGEVLFYLNSYYSRLSFLKSQKEISEFEVNQRLLSILNTERILSKDKIYIHKFFMHLSKKEQKRRLEDSKDKKKLWELSPFDKDQGKHYNRYFEIFDSILEISNTEDSPWVVLPADKKEEARIFILESIIKRMESILSFNSNEVLNGLNKGAELIP
ncbi:polyphosphate kinase [Leptospira sp. 96542]|nr:polyphosphate kinase [Leptospira sp. 96542]